MRCDRKIGEGFGKPKWGWGRERGEIQWKGGWVRIKRGWFSVVKSGLGGGGVGLGLFFYC